MNFLFITIFLFSIILLSHLLSKWFDKGILKTLIVILFSFIISTLSMKTIHHFFPPQEEKEKPVVVKPIPNNVVTQQEDKVNEALELSEKNTRQRVEEDEK